LIQHIFGLSLYLVINPYDFVPKHGLATDKYLSFHLVETINKAGSNLNNNFDCLLLDKIIILLYMYILYSNEENSL
jgi:hypothetical protein